jgi:hypothetical protein
MAFVPYNPNVPDAATQNITQITESIRQNFAALVDYIVAFGGIPGWNSEVQDSDGSPSSTPETPDQWMYSKNTERIKVVLTYITLGPASSNIETAQFFYSADSGNTWETMGDTSFPNALLTLTYDGNGYFINSSWS